MDQSSYSFPPPAPPTYQNIYNIDSVVLSRSACGIDIETSYVVTGGLYGKQRVTQYSLTGEVTELPDMINRREYHACSKFENNDGVTVSY